MCSTCNRCNIGYGWLFWGGLEDEVLPLVQLHFLVLVALGMLRTLVGAFFCHIPRALLMEPDLDTLGAQYSQSGEGAVCVCKVWIPFHNKHYSVRHLNGRFALWDDDGNHSINRKRVWAKVWCFGGMGT